MDERELFDQLYAAWARAGDDDAHWAARGDTLVTIGPDGEEAQLVLTADSAKFIASIHTAMPELIRRAYDALDEAERADRNRDEREQRIAALELECMAARKAEPGELLSR